MGQQFIISCDRTGCSNTASDWRGLDLATMIQTYGWKIEHWKGKRAVLACTECLAGRSEEDLLLIRAGRNMLKAVQDFDNTSDGYLVSCDTASHSMDGCVVHIFGDGDENMEGQYVRILSSGCGSYHAEMMAPDGSVVIQEHDEAWWR